MKKIVFCSFAVLAMLATVSCNKEQSEIPAPAENGKVYATISVQGEDMTKVSLDFSKEKNVQWLDTDQIAVFDGVSNNTFSVKEGSNTGASAVFEGTIDAGATTLYAVYPASAAVALDGSDLSVAVPSAQVIPSEGCVDPAALVSVASAARGSAMSFSQVCGLLRISFTAEDIRKITISGSALAGSAKVGADGVVKSVDASENAIVLTHADGIFPAGTYYVAVLPGTTPAGKFSVSLYNGLQTGMKTASGAVSFERCKGKDTGSMDGLTMYTVISTMPELFTWNSTRVVNGESEPENVLLAADIDMENEAWVPKDFKGVFDGQGHKLYNLNVVRTGNACLFNSLTGTIKNLTVGTSDGKNYDGVSRIVQDNPEETSVDTWRYAGLITRLNASALLDNVVNYVPVSVASTSKSKTRVGGLVGVVAAAATIKDCVNNGPVTISSAEPLAAGAVGGIAGWSDGALSAQNVLNFADVTVENAKTTYVAGILGCDNKGVTLTNCCNKGNVSITYAGSIAMCVGGIMGDSAKGSTLDCCDNFGAISTVCDGELKVGGIIGRVLIGCTLTNCTNGEEGTITFNPATFGSKAFVGGIVGNAPSSFTGTLTISACSNYAPLTATHRNVGCLGGIAGFLNAPSGKIVIKDCVNNGSISRPVSDTAAGKEGNVCLGGIAANLVGGADSGSVISGCINNAKVSTTTNAGSTTVRMAGIAAWLQSYVNVEGCENKGAVSYEMGSVKVVGSTVHVAGIVGHLVKGSAVSDCTNSGSIFANRRQVNRVGGIVGTINSSPVYRCTNTGSVTVEVPAETLVQFWQGVGGIAGFAEGETDGCDRIIRDCINRGAVHSAINAEPNYKDRYGVGGIIGQPFSSYTITGNKNYGSVYAKNYNEDAPCSFAGGVVGFDDDEHKSAQGSVITANANYGEVTNGSASADYSAAGGIFGKMGLSTGLTGSSFGSVNGPGAGAVAGVNRTDIAATVCSAATVNGVAKAAAADEAAWLCPANTGTITPTFVNHSDAE